MVADDLAEQEPAPGPAPLWEGLLDEDYDRAVVRLATICRAETSHLVFGYVELLPPEIASPPEDGVFQNFGEDRAVFSRCVLSVAHALAWYETARAGALHVPRKTFPVVAADLQPEPHPRRFVLRGDVPFAPAWHVSPRLHRLTPLAELPEPLSGLVGTLGDNERTEAIRQWFEARLHFDVLAHDDWLGSLALVLPNPLFRDHGARIEATTAQGETIEAGGAPRRGVSLEGVDVHFQEQRAGGLAHYARQGVDGLGRARTDVLGAIDHLGHRVVCSRRGVLHDDPAGWFWRTFNIGLAAPTQLRVAQVPARKPGDEAKPFHVQVAQPAPPPPPPTDALHRLTQLQARQAGRTGVLRPYSPDPEDEDIQLFKNGDREGAVEVLRRLIRRAHRRVTFVDPYFEAADLLDFAYAAGVAGVAVDVLLGSRGAYLRETQSTAPEGIDTRGAWLAHELAEMASPAKGFGPVTARVTTQRKFHDRFLRIDDEVWHCGHSFNGVGFADISAMVRIGRPRGAAALIDAVFAELEPFEAFWARASQVRPPNTWRHAVARTLKDWARRIEVKAPTLGGGDE